ncbi:hypothetical protein F2P81_008642 [Scophthalmus maximus]|uniref:Uncharacterized protein n=1 Tax=Scophthalmus maximus TaxID=52904 RepID=A0A6A4T1H2_SCOMX|nr:hypothetical protein F2P81_008642 [Scophthalmus maximus]
MEEAAPVAKSSVCVFQRCNKQSLMALSRSTYTTEVGTVQVLRHPQSKFTRRLMMFFFFKVSGQVCVPGSGSIIGQRVICTSTVKMQNSFKQRQRLTNDKEWHTEDTAIDIVRR